MAKFNQTLTRWQVTGRDAFDQPTYADAVDVTGIRWEDKATLFRSESGEELTSMSVVYSMSNVFALEDKLALGASATETTSRRVAGLDATPNIKTTKTLYKAYLV